MNQRAREVSNAKGEGNDGKSTHALPYEQRELAKGNYRNTDSFQKGQRYREGFFLTFT